MKNIIIVGAGFGGITAALTLAKKIKPCAKDYTIILIDRHHHQLYTPALYEIAAIPRSATSDTLLKSSVLIPIRDIIQGTPIVFISDEFLGFDPTMKQIRLKTAGVLSYEFLILALGSETNYFNIPGLKEHSIPLKTFDDALRLRNGIEDAVGKRERLRIVVGGGGSSGVELIAEFVNFVCSLQEKIICAPHVCTVEFLLIEASADILPGFEPWVVEKAKKHLRDLGVRVKTNTLITEVTSNEIILQNGAHDPYDLLIWTGGVRGPEFLAGTALPQGEKGAIMIDEYLRAGIPDSRIFAIGDNALFRHPKTGKPLVWNVPVAEAEGKLVAENILRVLRGHELRKFSPREQYPFILTVGKKFAIADLLYISFSGFLGWIAKLLVELRYLLFILPLKKALRTWWLSVKIYSSND